MDRPVGNSPGPDSTVSVTGGQLLIALPSLSTMVMMSCASSVPSTDLSVVLSEVNSNAAGMPLLGHAGGRMCKFFVAIPIPLAFRQPEIINQTHGAELASRNAPVVERAPDGFATAPRKTPGTDLVFNRARGFVQTADSHICRDDPPRSNRDDHHTGKPGFKYNRAPSPL